MLARLRSWLQSLGPGLVTGAADDDPSGIVTASQAGARYGYALLWTALYQIPLMSAIQLLAARIGLATRRNVPQVIADTFPRWVLWAVVLCLLVANTVNVAADLAGVAAGFELLTKVPHLWFVPFVAAAVIAGLMLAKYRAIRQVLKWLTLSLFAYVIAAVLSRPHWGEVLRRSFVPTVRWDLPFLTMWVALFGTTISPYLFVWQSAEEREERRMKPGGPIYRRATADTVIGMTISQLIAYAIILAAAATLYDAGGGHEPQTATEVAQALRPIGGGAGTILFAVGMIGTGLLAIPTLLAASGYTLAAAFGRPASIDARPRKATFFYGVIAASAAVGVLLDLMGVSPIPLLFGAAVVNGMLAPPLMLFMLIVSRDRRIMGEHRAGPVLSLLAGLTILTMGAGALYMAGAWLLQRI